MSQGAEQSQHLLDTLGNFPRGTATGTVHKGWELCGRAEDLKGLQHVNVPAVQGCMIRIHNSEPAHDPNALIKDKQNRLWAVKIKDLDSTPSPDAYPVNYILQSVADSKNCCERSGLAPLQGLWYTQRPDGIEIKFKQPELNAVPRNSNAYLVLPAEGFHFHIFHDPPEPPRRKRPSRPRNRRQLVRQGRD